MSHDMFERAIGGERTLIDTGFGMVNHSPQVLRRPQLG
jgi:hypothetical protein